jgi:hypothetical protein
MGAPLYGPEADGSPADWQPALYTASRLPDQGDRSARLRHDARCPCQSSQPRLPSALSMAMICHIPRSCMINYFIFSYKFLAFSCNLCCLLRRSSLKFPLQHCRPVRPTTARDFHAGPFQAPHWSSGPRFIPLLATVPLHLANLLAARTLGSATQRACWAPISTEFQFIRDPY